MVQGLRTSKGLGGAAANAVSAVAAQPVIVTNWPAGFGTTTGGQDAVTKNRKARTGRGRRLSRLTQVGTLAGRAGRVVPGATIALGALSMGSAAVDGDARGIASGGGALAGGLLGAKGGAMAGALGGPIGAAVGAALGGSLGSWLGAEAIDALYADLFSKEAAPVSPDVQDLNATTKQNTKALEENSRVVAQSNSKNRARRHTELGGLEAG